MSKMTRLLTIDRNRWALLLILILAVLGMSLTTGAVSAPEDPPDTESSSIEEPGDPTQVVYKRGNRISVFSGDTHIQKDVHQDGQIISVGGNVVVEGVVDEVVAVFGSVRVTGTVDGNMITVLSDVELDGATIGRDLINVLGGYENISSLVHGQDFHLSLGKWLPDVWSMLTWFRFLKLLMTFVLLVILAALAPNRIRTIGEASGRQYVAAFFMGLLGYLIFLIVVGLLSLTVIGLPIAMLGFWIIKWLGIAGIMFSVGHRLGSSSGRDLSVLGSILVSFLFIFLLPTVIATIAGPLGLIVSGFMAMVIFLCLSLPGVGLIFLTRFGTRNGTVQSPAHVAPPQMPVKPPQPHGPEGENGAAPDQAP